MEIYSTPNVKSELIQTRSDTNELSELPKIGDKVNELLSSDDEYFTLNPERHENQQSVTHSITSRKISVNVM